MRSPAAEQAVTLELRNYHGSPQSESAEEEEEEEKIKCSMLSDFSPLKFIRAR